MQRGGVYPLQFLVRFFASQFAKTPRNDGRWITLLFLATYFSAILVSTLFMKYDLFWAKYLRVCTSKPSFLDMHHLTSGLECTELGYDVLIQNPCEPNKLPMTYPRIWLHLSKLGMNQNHSGVLAVTTIVLFFLFVFRFIGRLNTTEGLFYGIVLCSPPIMLAVETGNIDLIVFLVLGFTLLVSQLQHRFRAISYLLILFAGVLKYFPIAAIISTLKETKRRALLIFTLCIASFSIYIAFTADEFILIHHQVQRSTYLSYGGEILFKIFEDITALSGFSLPHFLWRGAYFASLISVFLFVEFYVRRFQGHAIRSDFIDSFRYGAAIYIVAFVFWDNWDYRLIFLLFALPQILDWSKHQNALGGLSLAVILLLPVALWLSSRWPADMNFRSVNHFFFDEFINWFLFFYMAYALLLTLPAWLKSAIRMNQKQLPVLMVFDTGENPCFVQQPASSASNLQKSSHS